MRTVKVIGILLAYVALFFAADYVGYEYGAPKRTPLPRESTVALLLDFYGKHGSYPSRDSFDWDDRWFDVVRPLSWVSRFHDSLRREAGSWHYECEPASTPNEVRIYLKSIPTQEGRLVLHLKDGVVLPLVDAESGPSTGSGNMKGSP
jgi:hypothetical protein